MNKFYLSSCCFRLLFAGLLLFISGGIRAQIKIGANGNNIAPASLLELESTSQGLLIPRMPNTTAIDALNPPNGMLVYITTEPSGLYIRKPGGWEYLTGFLGGNAFFNSLTVSGAITAGSFSGPLTGNATTATTALNATNSANSTVINDISNPGITYPVFVNSTPGSQPLRTSSGNLSYVPATGILTARGVSGPLVGDVTGNATSAVDAENTVNLRITDDVVTPVTMYPTFVGGTSGPLPAHVSSSRLSFIPLTGELTAPVFRGDLLGNASSATSVTGLVNAVNGGTGQTIYTPGDILYADASNSLAKLPIGVPGTVLRVDAGNRPVWSTAGAGTVTSVSGTPNRISVVDATVAPVIDIDVNYAGQASINTVGTLTNGVWNGTRISTEFGGTGLNSVPANEIVIGQGAGNPLATISLVGTAGKVLTSNGPGALPTFETPGIGDMVLGVDQEVTAPKRFNDGTLVLNGSGPGVTTLKADANLNGTITLPSGTRTLVATSGTQTLSDKTLSSPNITGTGNFQTLSGTELILGGFQSLTTTQQTGTGNIVMSTGPTISNVVLSGTANAQNLTVSGTISAAGGFNGTATNTLNVGTLTTAAVEIAVNDVSQASVTANNTIVKRNASGDFTAGTITASLAGNANTATKLAASKNIFGYGFDGANDVTGIIEGTYGGTGVNNGTRTITVAGNFATVGGGDIILNSGVASSVTLPATGTLYGTAAGSISSANLSTSLVDKTGTGVAVFSIAPEIERPVVTSLRGSTSAAATLGSAGTGITIAGGANGIIGTDLAGTITITVGVGAPNESLVTISYGGSAFTNGSYPVLFPANKNAALLDGTMRVFVEGFTNRFTINSSDAALPAGQYKWNYQVIGH